MQATVKELHSLGWNDRMIHRETGLSFDTIGTYRRQLGLAANYTITPGTVRSDNKIHPHRARIIELLGQSYSDGYIARELGLNRRELNHYRRKHLRIEARPRKEHVDRDSGRRGQERSMGCDPSEVRASRYWSIGPRLGWPMGVRFRAVQLLECLLRHPNGMTRSQLRDHLGLTPGQMSGNDTQGTYLANLIARGLVAAAARVIPTGRKIIRKGSVAPVGSGQNVHLYFSTPLAVDTRAAWRLSHTSDHEESLLAELARLGRRKGRTPDKSDAEETACPG